MTDFSRRQFLKSIGAFAATLLTVRGEASSFPGANNPAPFEFLVIGDSIAWGQGLREENKFYYLTKQWLENEVFKSSRAVNLKVKAHSGATLVAPEREAEAFRRARRDEERYFNPEVVASFPTISQQIDIARREYESTGVRPEAVRLIMMTGGITDITVAGVLNPFGDDERLRRDIARACFESLSEVLRKAAATFPKALITLVGYFPIVSPCSSSSKAFNAYLEIYKFPRPLKIVTNNPLVRQTFFKTIKNRAVTRSRLWARESAGQMRAAVHALNVRQNFPRAVYVESPITEETCLETENSLLHGMLKNGRTTDEFFDARRIECAAAYRELRETTGIEYPMRFCEAAAVGHPNAAGARAYAENIKRELSPFAALLRQD